MLQNRRSFLKASTATALATGFGYPNIAPAVELDEIPQGERPQQDGSISVLNPAGRVPVSFIIDDSTCLVNMAHFAMPQFAQAWPDREDYRKPWRQWPREIPDSFVRKFGEWSRDNGVKGKYSVVPCPSCVGWVDRLLPGWSSSELSASLKLVRDLMVPNWDIHPEMISHTRVIDLRTGRPFEEVSAHTMENWHPAQDVTSDHLATYIALALQTLKNVDLPCEGFTTPGGFGNRVKSELSLAGAQAVRSVFNPEVPHYFKYVETGDKSTQPRVEHASGLGTDDPQCMVNVLAGTGDWFGGWDGVSFTGDVESSADRFITSALDSGRMVDLIRRGEPAIMLCHWPGIYCNGDERGFQIFQRAVTRLNRGYGNQIRWMKLSEIARYWAAKELTAISREGNRVILNAPFTASAFTLQITHSQTEHAPRFLRPGMEPAPLREVRTEALANGTFDRRTPSSTTVCIELPRGTSEILV
ncbi:MAG: twin-arginine translocation signal domain-containing protein [Verrucomicrobiae bacterium]|nr:twin-arginine translocation signal domain-containing protein [Verrucomicrobiae bacterium]